MSILGSYIIIIIGRLVAVLFERMATRCVDVGLFYIFFFVLYMIPHKILKSFLVPLHGNPNFDNDFYKFFMRRLKKVFYGVITPCRDGQHGQQPG